MEKKNKNKYTWTKKQKSFIAWRKLCETLYCTREKRRIGRNTIKGKLNETGQKRNKEYMCVSANIETNVRSSMLFCVSISFEWKSFSISVIASCSLVHVVLHTIRPVAQVDQLIFWIN